MLAFAFSKQVFDFQTNRRWTSSKPLKIGWLDYSTKPHNHLHTSKMHHSPVEFNIVFSSSYIPLCEWAYSCIAPSSPSYIFHQSGQQISIPFERQYLRLNKYVRTVFTFEFQKSHLHPVYDLHPMVADSMTSWSWRDISWMTSFILSCFVSLACAEGSSIPLPDFEI